MPSRKGKDTRVFPPELYIGKEHDGDDIFFVAQEGIESFDDGDQIAVYVLKEVRRKQVEHSML